MYFTSLKPSYSQLLYSILVHIPNFYNIFTVTGMKNAILTFGNGNEKILPNTWEREWEAGIPVNGREREFPLTSGVPTSQDVLFHLKAMKMEEGLWIVKVRKI